MSADDDDLPDDVHAEDPEEQPAPGQRLYTVAAANALIPHLMQVFAEFDSGRRTMQSLVERLAAHGVNVGQLIAPELADDPRVRPNLEALSDLNERLQDIVTGLGDLGVEVKGLDGLVDVRSRYQGRIVYLCWRRGEPAFVHWHDLDEGFAGREPIAEPEAFEGTLLN